MIERITVIGAGSTGHAVAGVMAMRGFKVTLCDNESFSKELNAVKELGFIQLRGRIRGIGAPAKVTTDPAEAIPGAQAIFIHVPSDRHEEVARFIAPYLEDGQHILIIPGNLGSFLFRDVDISPYTVAYLGEFEEDAASFLETADGIITVRLDTAEGR